MMVRISVGLLTVLIVACGSSRKELGDRNVEKGRYRAMSAQKYGSRVQFLFNESRTTVVCLKETKPSAQYPQHRVAFFVYDLSIDSTIFEDEIADGSVAWKDEFSILVSIVPGMVKSDDSPGAKKPGYIFDCRSRKTKGLDASIIE
jgi:hypothetical protein